MIVRASNSFVQLMVSVVFRRASGILFGAVLLVVFPSAFNCANLTGFVHGSIFLPDLVILAILVCVAVFAMRHREIGGAVLLVRKVFQMPRVNTTPVLASVMRFQPFWNGSNQSDVGIAMSHPHSVDSPKLSIACAHPESDPIPAACSFIQLDTTREGFEGVILHNDRSSTRPSKVKRAHERPQSKDGLSKASCSCFLRRFQTPATI